MDEDAESDSQEIRDNLLNHIILPRVLPQDKPERFIELKLMTHMIENVEDLANCLPEKTVELFRRLKRVHHECSPIVISEEIKSLRPGDTFAMFVRRQNTVFMIYMLPNEDINNRSAQNVILSTFPATLHPNQIYATESDIKFNYPVQAIKTEFSRMLQSVDFAHQLCFLYEELPIETKNRNYVHKWLLTLLADEKSTTSSTEEFTFITKKIRDEVRGKDRKNYFRRSGFYTSVKVLLQHSLTLHLGPERGKFLYKMIMLKFLNRMCDLYVDPKCIAVDVELLSQMIAKMSRRIVKLSQFCEQATANLPQDIVIETRNIIKKIRLKIDNQIQCIQKLDEENSQLPPLINLNFDSDVRHRMPKLRNYLRKREQHVSKNDKSSKYNIKSYKRYNKTGCPSIATISSLEDGFCCRIHWIEFEYLVLYEMEMNDERWTANDLRAWFFAYATYAEEKYKANQLLISKMILVRLKIIAVLDQRCITEFPLLKEHRSGINPNIINSLLLPQRADMQIAFELEEYFRQRNNVDGPGLTEEHTISERSFSVKYAMQNPKMKTILERILEMDKNKIDRKEVELTNARERVADLRNRASELNHHFFTNRWGNYRHSNRNYCRKCDLTLTAESVKMRQYEHLLPDETSKQLAVVFELDIPCSIACLRDILNGFIEFCTTEKTRHVEQLCINWINREGISNFATAFPNHRVTLGSTSKRYLTDYHVSYPFENFIVKNTSDCMLFADQKSIPISLPDNAIKNMCTLGTKDEYLGLQWTLNRTTHTQNQVIARQNECSPLLSLSEFKNFGSLRADGHRLQLRKLYAMIETDALSFEKESVLMLIMQTLWECEVSGDGKFIRESHFDFSEPDFCFAMIEILKKFVEQQKDNWANPLKLVMATLITIRAFEINEHTSVLGKLMEMLYCIRNIALDWIDKIEKSIFDMHNVDEKNERDLRLKLIFVAIAGSLTFFIHPKHTNYEKVFIEETNGPPVAQMWLQFIISLKNSINLYESNEDKLPSIIRLFLRMIETNGVYSESKIKDMIKYEDAVNLIKKQWTRATTAKFMRVYFAPDYPHILAAEVVADKRLQTVTIDIITGEFSVDGLPVSRLPNETLNDEIYQWFFGNMTFTVQPDAENNFSTLQKHNDCSYNFRNHEKDLIITEQTSDGSKKELLPPNIFKDDFPYSLAFRYSHWWNKLENCIEFRLRTMGKKHFSKQTTIDYRLDLNTSFLMHVKTSRPLIDIKSATYTSIVNQLSRLESSKYIHILMNNPQEAEVDLIRMNLKFKIHYKKVPQKHYDLESNEFIGMRIARTQKIGTLYGLNHGLVLENLCQDSTKTNRILLIPHGNIRINTTNYHVSVNIDIGGDLQNPPFHQYQVDEFCRQLKANNSSHASWFYLAYLHAVTSHSEIEPFTGMSGTERALQILQSAFAWSSSPYEPEAMKILNDIAKLSPIRKITDHRQIIQWPMNIPNRSARDSFIIIVKKLLENSQRLHKLYFMKSVQSINIGTNLDLNKREYRRCLQLNPNLCVSKAFIEQKVLKTSSPAPIQTSFCSNTQTVSTLYHSRKYKIPINLNLKKFLTARAGILNGIANKEHVKSLLIHSKYDPVADWWISLYDTARKQELNQEQITLILSLFAHQKEELEPILALQAVAMNPRAFYQICPPPVEHFNIAAGTYDANHVLKALLTGLCDWELLDIVKKIGDPNLDHLDLRTAIIKNWTENVTRSWPCDSVTFSKHLKYNNIEFDFEIKGANEAINNQLVTWNNNRKLDIFIKEVEERLTFLSLSAPNHKIPKYTPFVNVEPQNWEKYQLDFEEIINQNIDGHEAIINEAQDFWQMKKDSPRTANEWWNIINNILNCIRTKHLIEAGLFPRLVPTLLLPKIIINGTDDGLKALIGAWSIAISRERRENRLQIYAQRPELKGSLNRERETKPHSNWKPCERPEWLLFEIEQNLTIRPIQIEIANRMIDPPKREDVTAKHSVMQLNMGEGKTAVIVPILASVLANGTQVCQITVLKSLFATNLKALRQYLGGMLNQRIYTFPCRRDMEIGEHIDEILSIYKECKRENGVILTLPEYRLSFQLKIYESIKKDKMNIAKSFLNVHKWINSNVRNILDESDAILQPKYQLIYTVGNQLTPDGGFERWFVTQALLKRVPLHMKELCRKYGDKKIEFDDKYIENKHVFGGARVNYRSDVFTPCRILDDHVFDDLKKLLVKDFLDGQLHIAFSEINPSTKSDLELILTQKEIDKRTLSLIEMLPLKDRNVILILSGLLRFEVLKLVLTKRYRVNYGIDTKPKLKENRKMAIPFKAKDVAAEMTEFGHPDAAICFTQLSYYYKGLTKTQLYQVFDVLENEQNPSAIYGKWIQSIPTEWQDPSIMSYSGVNLDDTSQRDGLLFPLLAHNMYVIDFWLSKIVFPKEAKTFEQKLMCSAWDLASDHLMHRVTGFSGTNDTKKVLPLPITQNDLEKLEKTNENMVNTLLNLENRSYEALPAIVSGKEIIDKLIANKIPVLLDSGALMLELTNEQVAIEWLSKVESNFEASVYFDSNDVLQTIDRRGVKTEFDCSVYRENLKRCLVYLDDAHTRGTDLKFPLEWKACVTLSGDMTRDKTVQSCMRMRQLGKGQSISFLASYEADVRIRKMCQLSNRDNVTYKHVIEFICHNSKEFVIKNMVHWTASALNYTKKLIGHKLFENANDKDAMERLYEICVDDEFAKLIEMYGDKKESLLVDVAWSKFDRLAAKHRREREIQSFIRALQRDVDKKLDNLAPNEKQFSNALDEEQEKELETETEEERCVERPPPVKPATPIFNPKLPYLIYHGVNGNIDHIKKVCTLLSIEESLSHTTLLQYCRNIKNAWSAHLFVTKDYQTVIDSNSKACDDFLRPVWWIAHIKNTIGNDILVLLSSFECNQLLPIFRASVKSTLYMYRPRLSKMHSNLLHNKKIQVTGMNKDTMSIEIQDEVQIEVYSGAMYFESEAEQDAYCGFLGLVPRPRKMELENAFEEGIIEPKGFVPPRRRQYSTAISNCVGQCNFQENPVDLVIKIIEAHHQTLLKESHASTILEVGIKASIENTNYGMA